MRTAFFTRPTILAAIELLEARLSQARFGQLVLRLGMEDAVPPDSVASVAKKAVLLGGTVLRKANDVTPTVDGNVTLAEAVVREAVRLTAMRMEEPKQNALIRGLALDGYVISWDEDGRAEPLLRAALPAEVDLPAADDEVHLLLNQFGFLIPLGHLDQGIEAHTRGDWAAANSQARTFLEGLLDAIAGYLQPKRAGKLISADNRRSLLAEIEFLSVNRNEWTADGKNYINGLFKMLHTDGSHPGLSTEDHCTFRLHVVLITARMLLRRLNSESFPACGV